MRLRSLSVAVLASVLLVPAGASAASAHETAVPTLSAAGATKTFKTSAAKRLKRAARAVPVVAPRTATTSVVVGPTRTVSYSDRVLALTNAERTSRGLRALAFSSCADGFANTWAGVLAGRGSLSHQAMSPILATCGARGVGENVGFGNVAPAELVRMWMGSAAHRANILNPAFTHLGVGEVTTSSGRVYGVQVFLTL